MYIEHIVYFITHLFNVYYGPLTVWSKHCGYIEK